ncbi:MAG: carotenoid biosynthesis protein [Deltaproteobacteria bacterium]|nr:carotenoid biosynthesis protein [Deltaproteobacteria bacterium]
MLHRPYVLAFLCAFLYLAIRRFGTTRALFWLTTGYWIAWISEASSIRNGFPYGWYSYRYENLTRDWLLWGVPVWDSLSYPFLIYASYTTATFLLRPREAADSSVRWRRALLGAALTMLLDIIIDPVANLGERWFLGDIYDYAHPGWYFGVPFTNFLGWFLVPLVIILVNQWLWELIPGRTHVRTYARTHNLMDLAFYFSIALFNIVLAWSIGAYALGAISSILLLAVGLLVKRQL